MDEPPVFCDIEMILLKLNEAGIKNSVLSLI